MYEYHKIADNDYEYKLPRYNIIVK